MPADALRKRKIAVLGSRSVGESAFTDQVTRRRLAHVRYHIPLGKSSLVIQFVEDHFVESYYPTIESTFTKDIKHNGTVFECDIIDTAGQVSQPLSLLLRQPFLTKPPFRAALSRTNTLF